jgi:hypothetical protein
MLRGNRMQGLLLVAPPKEEPQPGVLSALQAFETALMLVALNRWPSVIPLAWSGCESLLRSKYKDLGSAPDIHVLQEKYYEDTDLLSGLNAKAHKFRKLRNRIQHEGFSPRDDLECMEVFFDTGIPYFAHIVEEVLGEPLSYNLGADERFKPLLRKIRKSVANKRLSDNERHIPAFFLQKFLRRSLSPTFFSAFDDMVIDRATETDAAIDAEWTLKASLCDALEALTGHDGQTYELAALYGPDGLIGEGVTCPACEEWVLAVMNTSEKVSGYKFERLVGVGCWHCNYVVSAERHVNIIRAFFQEEMSEGLIARIDSSTPPLARETFPSDAT